MNNNCVSVGIRKNVQNSRRQGCPHHCKFTVYFIVFADSSIKLSTHHSVDSLYAGSEEWHGERVQSIPHLKKVIHLMPYRIAGNFWGRKLSRISWFYSHPRKFSPQILGMPHPLCDQFNVPRRFFLRNASFLPIHLPWKFPTIIWYLSRQVLIHVYTFMHVIVLAMCCLYIITYMCTCIHHSREDSVIFSKRQGYQVTMKKVAQLQDKIEGMEVSTCTHQQWQNKILQKKE